MNKEDNLNKVSNIKEELEKKDYNSIFQLVLEPHNRETFQHRLEEHQDEFLKIEQYAKCNENLSILYEKIKEIEDSKIRELFAEYNHQLNIQSEYDICLASALALRDGLLIGMLK